MIFSNRVRGEKMRRLRGTLLLALVLLLGVLLGSIWLKGEAEEAPLRPSMPSAGPSELPDPSGEPLSWELTLVNGTSPLEADPDIQVSEVENGFLVDSRIREKLTAMLRDCRAEGLDPWICSAYRSVEKQQALFEKQLKKQQELGLRGEEAVQAAAQVVAKPGTSEHNLGLAVDIVSKSYQLLDEAQAETEVAKWLKGRCAEYGFVLRYPPEKADLTGVIFEPWHFRYVGEEAARKIMERGLCLEEYLEEK